MGLSVRRYRREMSVAVAYAALLLVLAAAAPGFFSAANLRDLMLGNVPVLVVAAGMTLVILAGGIDISVGSQFAVASVAAGVLAKAGRVSRPAKPPGGFAQCRVGSTGSKWGR